MENIVDIHEAVYDFLEEYREQEISNGRTFYYTFRRSNQKNKLDEGFWFYGNDNYLAVSFWSGMDWKNKTPNIFFRITNEGRTFLTITTKDSIKKAESSSKYFVKQLELNSNGKDRWTKEFQTTDYLQSLQKFLGNEKIIIDRIINENLKELISEDETNSIGFINPSEFEKWHLNVKKYKEELGLENLPFALTAFTVEKYKPIDRASFSRISKYTPFIFLVGENGSGKTSLLKALATAIGNKFYLENYDPDNSSWLINFSLNINGRTNRFKISKFEPLNSKLKSVPFASFGPSRLITQDRYFGERNSADIEMRMHPLHSIFRPDAVLKDLNRWIINQLSINSKNDKESSKLRYENIKQMLVNIIPNLYDIREMPWDGTQELLYFEEDLEGNKIEKGVNYNHLSSGLKSLIAMLGDMMLRLFEQQTSIVDPAELEGIVLIDEIDIHLHPKWQKQIPEILHDSFPRIQFIVTTHSPIPLLGAPLKSRIYVVKRTAQEGVAIERMDNRVMFEDLLPNAILTSPIFDLEEIIPVSHNKNKLVRTEDTYKEVLENNELRIQLKEIARNLRKS
ncbi:MAG: AAA family ATPase [Bacteroidetes bacterium]|nr:AAA family ATPase [Bacteroidota bacterium]